MRLSRAAVAVAVATLCACAAGRVSPPPLTAGRWRPFDHGLPQRGQWRQGFAIADFDADGHLDLAHGAPRHGRRRPALFRGDGRGNWTAWEEARFPPLGYAYGDIEAADFDADGHLDLALAMHQRGIAILRGDGAGRFTHWSPGLDLGPAAFASRALAIADWDGDGRDDVVAYGQGPRIGGDASRGVRVLLNEGGGAWRVIEPLPGMRNFGDSIAVGDFDADGRNDIAVSSGRLGGRDIVLLRRGADALEAISLPLAGRPYVRAVAAVAAAPDAGRDLPGHDLVVAYLAIERRPKSGATAFDEPGAPGEVGWAGHLDLFQWRGGAWTRRPLLSGDAAMDIAAIDAIRVGDSVEIAALGGDGRVVLLHASAARSSTLVFDANLAPRDGCRGRAVQLRDIDGDQSAEIVAAFAGAPSDAAPQACPRRGRLRIWTRR